MSLSFRDEDSGSIHGSRLSEGLKLPIGVYTPILHSSSVNQWVEMANNEIVIVSPAVRASTEVTVCLLIFMKLLMESLAEGLLAISQIHLLVLDNCSDLKNSTSHPILRVMQDFYRVTDELSRPRVVAFTRPLNGGPQSVHRDLEQCLDAKTLGNTGELRSQIGSLLEKPMELVIFYEPQISVQETRLFSRLRLLDPRGVVFNSQFRNAKLVLHELGPCASDFIWRRTLKDIEAAVQHAKPVYEEEDELKEGSSEALLKVRMNVRDVIKDWSFAMPNLDRSSRGFNVSPKFTKLMQVLKACEPQGEAFRGIVFGT